MKIKMRCTRGEYRSGVEYELPQPQAKAMIDYGVAWEVKAAPPPVKKKAVTKKKTTRRSSFLRGDDE